MRRSIQRQSQGDQLLLLGPVSLHGIRPTHLPRKPARYRGLPPAQPVRLITWASGERSPAIPWPMPIRHRDWRIYADFAQILIAESPKTLRRRFLRHRAGANGLCPGFDNHRPVPGSLSLGTSSANARAQSNSIPFWICREHSIRVCYYQRESSRCQYPRQADHRSRGHLHHGSRLSRFRAPLQHSSCGSILCHSDKNQLQLITALLPDQSTNPPASNAIRSCRSTVTTAKKDYPEKLRRIRLLRFKEQQNAGVSDQQLYPAGHNDCRALSLPLADRIVLQMDQTASPNQGFLWHNRECSQNSNLDRHLGLCLGRHREEDLESGAKVSTQFYRF